MAMNISYIYIIIYIYILIFYCHILVYIYTHYHILSTIHIYILLINTLIYFFWYTIEWSKQQVSLVPFSVVTAQVSAENSAIFTGESPCFVTTNIGWFYMVLIYKNKNIYIYISLYLHGVHILYIHNIYSLYIVYIYI